MLQILKGALISSSLYYLYFYVATQLWRKKVAQVAKEFKDIKFAVADDQEYADSTLKDFGLEDSGEEFNFGCFKDGKKYGMEPMEEYEEDDVIDFLKKLQKGNVYLVDLIGFLQLREK